MPPLPSSLVPISLMPVLPLSRHAVAGLTALALTLAGLTCGPACATTLITEHEAELPLNEAVLRSGIERGPEVIPIYPAPKSAAIQSPFGFRAFHLRSATPTMSH
jgi:hypothetical protein